MKALILAATAVLLPAFGALAQTVELDQAKQNPQFNLEVKERGDKLVIWGTGEPKHEFGPFPGIGNPNRLMKQSYRFDIPSAPQRAAQPLQLPRVGAVGITISGVPIYNQYTAEGHNAVEGPLAEIFDNCNGHPQARGAYHYHQSPKCILNDKAGVHSTVIGWAFDGFALYGPNSEGGKPPTNLDTCNGHQHGDGRYHYHVTKGFPYTIGCYTGEVAMDNFRRGPPGGKGKFGKRNGKRKRKF